MRPLLALALVLFAACRSDRSDAPAGAHDAPSSNALRGPDPLVLRVPRAGGPFHVSAYPALDSVVWRSPDPAPAIQRVIGFDRDAGIIAYVDSRRIPGRINLRLGEVGRASRAALREAATADAGSIFGVTDTSVVRLTSTGSWSFRPPRRARMVFPLRDGAAIVLADQGSQSVLWRVRPPGTTITDTVEVPRVASAVNVPAAGQILLALDGGVMAMSTRTLQPETPVEVEGEVHALVSTPSADRLLVLAGEQTEVAIIDRYQRRVERTVELPGAARALRMDPLGRYLLVRAQSRDSVWIVAIGTGRVIGTLRSEWREDLPFVATDGAVALVQGEDVVFVDGETLRPGRRVENGARDFWYPFQWTGFRPRDAALDQPATFPTGADTSSPLDTLGTGALDSLTQMLPPGTTLGPPAERPAPQPAPAPPPAPAARVYYTQFAAVADEARARRLAGEISVDGTRPHVLTVRGEGGTLHRVVLGPYATRDAAERIGRSSRQSFWIFEAAP